MFVFDLSKTGVDVLGSSNPNDFILKSGKNTFKFIAEGLLLNQSVTSDPTTFSIFHGLGYVPGFYAFCMFPDGKVAMPDSSDFVGQPTVNNGYGSFFVEADEDYLYFELSKAASNYDVDISWMLFEAPVAGSPPSDLPTGFKTAITKEGIDYFDADSPDDFDYHSGFNTLKYETQGEAVVSVNRANYYHMDPGSFPIFPATYYHRVVGEITHGLGYVPYFAGYILDIPTVGRDIQAPFLFGDFVFFAKLSVYADATKLYFLVQFNSDTNTGTVDFNFGYRLFKNDLGL